MSRRVVIGKFPDGSMRLRTSLQGYDAFTAPDDPNYISFDSNWSDLVKVHKVGVADLYNGPLISFADLGYTPFMEIKQLWGQIIYDDYLYVGHPSDTDYLFSGYNASITRTGTTGGWGFVTGVGMVGYNVFYVVYQVPVPE